MPALLGLLTLCVADACLRRTRPGPEADRSPALLLLPGDVPAAAHQRPVQRGVLAGRKSVVYSMAGSLWLQAIDSDDCRRAHLRPGLRLSTRLVARRTLHRVCAPSRRCDRALAARPGDAQDAAVDADAGRAAASRGIRRTAAASRSCPRRAPATSISSSRSSTTSGLGAPRAVHRAARERDPALLLFDARSHDQSVVDAGWQEPGVRVQSRDAYGTGRSAASRSRPAQRLRASSTRRRAGARIRKWLPMAGACCTAAIKAGNGISCG